MLDKLPPEILEMIFKNVLVYVRPTQTSHPVTPSRSGRQWPLPYRSVSIALSDLALFGVSWYVREVALQVFWTKNTFLYCPESVGDSKKAITFLTAQPPYVLNNYLRNLQAHFFLESTHRFPFDEEFTARLQPLERVMKKLDWPRATTDRDKVRKNSKSERRVDFRLWPSGEHHNRQTCRRVRYMALA
ncbi:hypothetical protein VTN00DRAFT_786 [Thermoascus crustaceus]|uniref:uncharacterized protein n=1 Tax=Thermoascus crustaceus TaxID=5088 RepID=UPI00374360E9